MRKEKSYMRIMIVIFCFVCLGYTDSLEEMFTKTVIQLPAEAKRANRITLIKKHLKEVQAVKDALPNEITRQKEEIYLYEILLSGVIDRIEDYSKVELINHIYWGLNGAGGMKYSPKYVGLDKEGKMVIALINAFFANSKEFEYSEE